jgi:recombination protein RecT
MGTSVMKPQGSGEGSGPEPSKSLARQSALPAPMVQTMQTLMPHVPTLLPSDISTEQFRAALYLELSGRADLADCTQESLRECVVKSATYGLLPGRDCHFLPFRNKRKGGKKDATYVPNYHGIILALERSGKVRRAFAHPVHEGDEWGFDLFADRPTHKPAVTLGKKAGKELFYYGAIMFKDGTCHFEVVTLEDLDAIKKRAPSHDDGPWVTDAVMMKRKSALKRVAKYVKLTPEQHAFLAEDEDRERGDIPPERHQQNIVDLFGEGGSGYEHAPAAASAARKESLATGRTPTQGAPEPVPEGVDPATGELAFDYERSAALDRAAAEEAE